MNPARTFLVRCAIPVVVALTSVARADQYCKTVPGGYQLVGCNLSIESVSIPLAMVSCWTPCSWTYQFDEIDLVWLPSRPPIGPRGGATFAILVQATNQICFFEPTNAPALPLNLASGYAMQASCQSNIVATFEDIVGRAPINGTCLYRFVGGHPYQWDSPVWGG